MSRRLPGFVPNHSAEISPLFPISSSADLSCLLPERVELTVNSKKKQMAGSKMGES